MAAISGLLESLPPDTHIVIPDDCYTGLRVLGAQFLPQRGIRVSTLDMTDLDAFDRLCQAGVDLIWAETSSNPRMQVSDIQALSQAAFVHEIERTGS